MSVDSAAGGVLGCIFLNLLCLELCLRTYIKYKLSLTDSYDVGHAIGPVPSYHYSYQLNPPPPMDQQQQHTLAISAMHLSRVMSAVHGMHGAWCLGSFVI